MGSGADLPSVLAHVGSSALSMTVIPSSPASTARGTNVMPAESGSVLPQHQQCQAPPDDRPRTRLRDGIPKPRLYTDGTIRYGMHLSTGEPTNLAEDLSNSN
jgi:hypothetical protein